jgi:hypothetical protein
MSSISFGGLLPVAVVAAAAAGGGDLQPVSVRDIFGRELNRRGIVLVDWEGHVANPAFRLAIHPPAGAAYPARAVLRADHGRLYFDLPCKVGRHGAEKAVELTDGKPAAIYLAVFPDRDTADEKHRLTVTFTDKGRPTSRADIPIRVIDQDRRRPAEFQVTVDFGQDRTGFFRDRRKQAVVRQAVDDWAYFLADPNADEVPAGGEKTWIWRPEAFKEGRHVTNAKPYRGFLVYAYGVRTPELRSGGEPSLAGGWQTSGGRQLPVKRSGGVEIETRGNFNRLGWFLTSGPDDWWRSGNLGKEANDLYSIARHELGHTFIFNPANRLFQQAKKRGQLSSPALLAYHGRAPRLDRTDHLPGAVDRLSRRGAFGNEYHGPMPRKRWLITRLDLLCAQAIGYKLRDTTPFRPLAIVTRRLPPARQGDDYEATPQGEGGVAVYCWDVVSGSLPPGLGLDSFTGEITGKPTRAGTHAFTLRLRDCDEQSRPVVQPLKLHVCRAQPTAASAG